MRSDAETVEEYLAGLPADRRPAIEEMLALVRRHLPEGYVEAMNWGMICWEVPLEVSGPTCNGRPLMYAALAAQKRHDALYLCGANCKPEVRERLLERFAAVGRKADMGAACLRYRRLDKLDLEAVGQAVAAVPVEAFVAASAR